MTQIASLLAVATVFVGLWTLNIYVLQSEGGLYVRKNYLCKNLSQKYRGGACLRNSTVIADEVSTTMYIIIFHWHTEYLKNLFSVKYSDKGSVYRPAEEQTYINYVDFLDECEGMGVLYISFECMD